jgi:anti-sigma factor RsiW
MKCEEARENLAAYLDGEIEGASRRAMDDHLAVCPACAAERRAQAAAWRLLDLSGPPAAPAGLEDRILARARAGGGGGGGRILRFPVPVAAAAAILLAAGGAVLFLKGGPGADAPGEPPSDQLLDELPVLEAMDVLQDGDADAADRLADAPVDDLDLLGG